MGATIPVNLVNGNFFLTAGDFFIPGRGMSLQLARSYNSLAAANGEQGAFGPGWTHSYETQVISKTGGMTVTVVEGDGARHVYTLNLSKPCATAACYDSPPGLYRELRVIPGLGYQVIHKNGTIQQFEPDGRLVEIVDRNNNHINLYYSPACTLMGSTNALCQVNDTSTMRDLLFQYDDTSGIPFITSVQERLLGGPGRQITYAVKLDSNASVVYEGDWFSVPGTWIGKWWWHPWRWGLLWRKVDANLHETAYDYDNWGNTTVVTTPLNATQRFLWEEPHYETDGATYGNVLFWACPLPRHQVE